MWIFNCGRVESQHPSPHVVQASAVYMFPILQSVYRKHKNTRMLQEYVKLDQSLQAQDFFGVKISTLWTVTHSEWIRFQTFWIHYSISCPNCVPKHCAIAIKSMSVQEYPFLSTLINNGYYSSEKNLFQFIGSKNMYLF